MFNLLFSLFKKDGLSHIANITSYLYSILNIFEVEFQKDKDARNAAIDCIIDILKQHKDKV